MESVRRQKVVGGPRIMCEAGNSMVLTCIGRQRDVGKREAGLVSIENVEEVGQAVISVSLFLNVT